jgi:hypothetical protein
MGSDNEIVRGNESKMNYFMTIKKEEQDRRTIYEDDNGYYKEKYSIFKHYHYHYHYFSSAVRPDFK